MANPAAYLIHEDQKRTAETLKDVLGDGSFYTLEYLSDYRLGDVLASGASNGNELKNVLSKLLIADRLPAPSCGAGCSAFIAKNREGHVIVGRNYDFTHELSSMLVRTSPEGGYKSMGMIDLGFLDIGPGQLSDGKTDLSPLMMMPYMTLDGINERGFFIAVLQLRGVETHQDTGKTKIMTTTAIRAVLDRAATVGEAEEIFRSYDMHTAREKNDYHFFVADRGGASAVFEYFNNEFNVIRTDCVTNFMMSPGARKRGGGKERFRIIDSVLRYRSGSLEKDEAMDTLRLVSQPYPPKGKSNTLWSAVYDLTDGTLELATGRGYGEPMNFRL